MELCLSIYKVLCLDYILYYLIIYQIKNFNIFTNN